MRYRPQKKKIGGGFTSVAALADAIVATADSAQIKFLSRIGNTVAAFAR